ncbi:MAG: metal ABC transporter permease [Planctomycetes bacterium]|nr:metal ABC transporter permease [Planctomycetota bacterium]
MNAFFQSMERPFVDCLLLAGILVYLGIHVLARKVIFVDLALAQIAALGSVWGALLGWDIHSDPWQIKAFSLAFTLLGAFVFTVTRMRDERVPHEALIGIAYAVALGATMLASAHLAHGAEEVSELLAGSILWVQWDAIAFAAALFAAVGVFHWTCRRRFFLISMHHGEADAKGVSLQLWDFLFYASLGFVVTSAVSIAGVLLVFSYLVIPAVVAMLFADRIGPRLAIGWSVGTLVSAIGCSLSYFEDLPSGPTIVACFGGFLVLAGLVHYVARSGAARGAALLRVGGGALAFTALAAGSFLLKKDEGHDVLHVLETGNKAERMLALAEIRADPELWTRARPLVPALLAKGEIEVRVALLDLIDARKDVTLLGAVHPLLADADDSVRDKALRCVRDLASKDSVPVLLAVAAKEEDEYLKVEFAETLLELGDARGLPVLLDVMETGEAAQARRDAWEHLHAHWTFELPYRPEAGSEENRAALAALRRAWNERGAALRSGPDGVFR